jgi:hypothetical protein
MTVVSLLCLQVILGLSALVTAQSGQYGQCGGIGWTGPTTCVSGWTCVKSNDCGYLFHSSHFTIAKFSTADYSQCLPGAATSTQSPSSSSSTSSRPSSSSSSSASAPTQRVSNVSPAWAAAYSKVNITVSHKLGNMPLSYNYRHKLLLPNCPSQIRSI